MYNIYSDDITEIQVNADEIAGEITLSAFDQDELDVTGYDQLGHDLELSLQRTSVRRQTERKVRIQDYK